MGKGNINIKNNEEDIFKILNQIEKDIVKVIQGDRYNGIGKPEALKANVSEQWSGRIDEVNRIVSCEMDNSIIIASYKGHYVDSLLSL